MPKAFGLIKPYLLIILAFCFVIIVSSKYSLPITDYIQNSSNEGGTILYFILIFLLFAIGFFVYHLAKSTPIPSFVLAILFGFAAQEILHVVLNNVFLINILVTLGAVYILFGGGLETPFKNFKKLAHYIFSLAFVGTIITAFTFSVVLFSFANWLGFDISLPIIILLGAALASTDPAAIIPSFEKLIFKKPRVKYIAISESALNDVVGAILTIVFLRIFQTTLPIESITHAYGLLLDMDTIVLLLRTLGVGIAVGILGYYILEFWHGYKKRNQTEEETDNAFFLAIPILAFSLAEVFGGPGSGLLAAFMSALLFNSTEHIKHVELYFNSTVKSFMKPMIFIILGSLIDFPKLIDFAPIGIAMAVVFVCILRPLVVLITLGPWSLRKASLDWRELAFLSFVRETGVIPAVLLITLAESGIAGSEVIVPIGMWIILFTLLIGPPLTPWLAKKLQIAEEIDHEPVQQMGGGVVPTAVLVSRGRSFARRLPHVVEWALKHHIYSIAVLHSPEEKYSSKYVKRNETIAKHFFEKINLAQQEKGAPTISFEIHTTKGPLHSNIRRYIKAHDNISIIFAGKRMLDFRSKEIKHLHVPFFFID